MVGPNHMQAEMNLNTVLLLGPTCKSLQRFAFCSTRKSLPELKKTTTQVWILSSAEGKRAK